MDQLERVRKEVGNLRLLLSNPKLFFKNQTSIYRINPSFAGRSGPINEHGLPTSTESFYALNKTGSTPSQTDCRVLNIGSSGDGTRNLAAINLDLDGSTSADIVYDGEHIPFPDDYFTIVRASHILEHIERGKITDTLREWSRVLHPDGELHIAVPDARVTFDEIIKGKTPKGQPALSNQVTTAPLTQIYGLGYEDGRTDPRWRHHIIFDRNLLKYFLEGAGFDDIRESTDSDNLAAICGIKDDSQSHYSLNVIASHQKTPNQDIVFLLDDEFEHRCDHYLDEYGIPPDISYIIPVYNEAKNLPLFLDSLGSSKYRLQNNIEYIFVLNGCDDDSGEVIKNYARKSKRNIILTESEKGINNALLAGEKARKYSGLIGKLDADIALHPQAIDTMTMHLLSNPGLEVTYAEPIPVNTQNQYNEVEHDKQLRSRRLYYHGRASLFQNNPCEIGMYAKNSNKLLCEDVLLSYYFAYFRGLDSISSAPHSYVYSKSPDNLPDLELQRSRLAREIQNVHKLFPPFAILDSLFERDIYSRSYREILRRIHTGKTTINEWGKIRSTKA